MAVEFTVDIEDKPGSLAELGHLLGEAGINIEAIHAVSSDGVGRIRILVSDDAKARQVLEDSNMDNSEREVVLLKVSDKPGTLGDVAMVMADAGVNIDSVYLTITGLMVLGVSDAAGAQEVAGGMAVMTTR